MGITPVAQRQNISSSKKPCVDPIGFLGKSNIIYDDQYALQLSWSLKLQHCWILLILVYPVAEKNITALVRNLDFILGKKRWRFV